MTYNELFQLKGLNKIKLHAGKSIMMREIEGAHVFEITDTYDFVKRGELIFVSGVAFNDVQKDLKKMITALAQKNVAGLVVEIGPYINDISEDVISMADKFDVPLLSIPFDISVSEIISQIYYEIYRKKEIYKSMELFMKELIYGDEKIAKERMELFEYNPEKIHLVLYFALFDMHEQISRVRDSEILEDLLWVLKYECFNNRDMLYLKEEDGIVVIYEYRTRNTMNDKLTDLSERVESHFSMKHKEIKVKMGIGKILKDIEDTKKSAWQAKGAVKVMIALDSEKTMMAYENLGIYRLFLNINDENELLELYHKNLDKLIEYDKSENNDFVNTLQVYIDNGGSITKTTENLYVHRNTVKYRINRIKEIMKIDLDDPKVQFDLKLSFAIRKYLSKMDKWL